MAGLAVPVECHCRRRSTPSGRWPARAGAAYLEVVRCRGARLAAPVAPDARVDAGIAPVAPVAAPTIDESDVGNSPAAQSAIQRLTWFNRPINYLGLPSLATPAGFT